MDEQLLRDAEAARNGANTHRMSALIALCRNYGPKISKMAEEELRGIIAAAKRSR